MVYDVCIIGSGAGAGPIAYELCKAGKKVFMLEKGEIFTESDFSKDEISFVRRDIIRPNLKDEYHTIEEFMDGGWVKTPTYQSGWSWWNGSMLGGSSNLMSGYFHRLKPNDFKLKSVYGKIEGANVVDWAISYDELEPYYAKVEKIVGVSGEVTKYKHHEPRSTLNYPYPRLEEHPISHIFDLACKKLNFTAYKVPRAIISLPKGEREACYYSNFCGSYPCASGAKGSSRVALLVEALKSGNLTLRSRSFVYKLESDRAKVKKAYYFLDEKSYFVKAKVFVVAAQAVESVRLLLNSKNTFFPNGLANNNAQVGKNMVFSGGGVGGATFDESVLPKKELFASGLFVNRALVDWYFTDTFKGGVVDFLFEHANPIRKANSALRDENGNLLLGKDLQKSIYERFQKRVLTFEVFNDWLPNDNCFVSVDKKYKDKYGVPVANIRIGAHPQDIKVGKFLAQKALHVMRAMGGKELYSNISNAPAQNLQGGGCRFGDNPKTSVLNRNCQAHELHNLFVTDGSFMPTAGSATHTWTIYANAFRVANFLLKEYFKNI